MTWAQNTAHYRAAAGGCEEIFVPARAMLEPNIVCLTIEAVPNDCIVQIAGTLHKDGNQDEASYSIVSDGRRLLVHLGSYFVEAPASSPVAVVVRDELEDEPSAPDEADQPTSDLMVLRSLAYDKGWLSRISFAGPHFLPTSVRVLREAEHATELIRSPHSIRESLDFTWSSASCPEVFLRVNRRSWTFCGTMLVRAIGPERARTEVKQLGTILAGQEVSVLIREVAGEEARIHIRLLQRDPGTNNNLCVKSLSAVVTATTPASLDLDALEVDSELSLELSGYYLRTTHVSSQASANLGPFREQT